MQFARGWNLPTPRMPLCLGSLTATPTSRKYLHQPKRQFNHSAAGWYRSKVRCEFQATCEARWLAFLLAAQVISRRRRLLLQGHVVDNDPAWLPRHEKRHEGLRGITSLARWGACE